MSQPKPNQINYCCDCLCPIVHHHGPTTLIRCYGCAAALWKLEVQIQRWKQRRRAAA